MANLVPNMEHVLQVVVARAEALAKAQFAHRRDPHDCALLYLALKKKQLLMVSHASPLHVGMCLPVCKCDPAGTLCGTCQKHITQKPN